MEYLLLFLALARFFDGDALTRLPGEWRVSVHLATSVAGGAVLGLAAGVIFWGDLVRAELQRTNAPPGWGRGWLVLHAAACLVFAWLSFLALGRPDLVGLAPTLALAAWLGAGALAVLALLIAGFGARILAGLARRLGPTALAAGVCGALASLVLQQVLPYWTLLALPTLKLTAALLGLFSPAVYTDPARHLLGLDGFFVMVNPSCSGIEGMALTGLLLGGYLVRFRREHRFPRTLLIVPLGIALAFAANLVRIAFLVAVGAHVHPQFATGAFHSMAGWIFFCLLSIGLVALVRRIPWLRRPAAS